MEVQTPSLAAARSNETPARRAKWLKSAAVFGALITSFVNAHADLTRIQSLLDATPAGGWVNASVGAWNTAWPAIRPDGNVGSIAYAWGSFAWDPVRDDLLIYGGGHANYAGNEIYVWDGGTGLWSRGTLPSRLDTNLFVVGNGAPQASHTYDNTLYLPLSDRYVTFGGAAWNSGSNYTSALGREGPWLWNPALADPNRVGGQDFTGLDPAALGSNSWTSRRGSFVGTLPQSFVESVTAYRQEAGRDVVYISADVGASSFPRLYRYEFNLAGTDVVQEVGVMGPGTSGFQGAAAIDSARGWFVRTVFDGGPGSGALAVWDLSLNNASNPSANPSFPVQLQFADGTRFVTGDRYGIAFDEVHDRFLLWNGRSDGDVYYVEPAADVNGLPDDIWTVTRVASATPSFPTNFGTGVLGKFHYVDELGAFVALDDFSFETQDAEVWFYKPAAEVPELGTTLLFAAGLPVLAWAVRRRRGRGR